MWTRRVDINICEHMGNGFRLRRRSKFFESGFLRDRGLPGLR